MFACDAVNCAARTCAAVAAASRAPLWYANHCATRYFAAWTMCAKVYASSNPCASVVCLRLAPCVRRHLMGSRGISAQCGGS